MKHLKMTSALVLAAHAAAAPEALLSMPMHDAANVAEMIREVKQQIEQTNSDLNKKAEDALKQAKTSGDMSSDVKAEVDRLLQQQKVWQDGLEKIQNQLNGLDGVSEQVVALEQKLADRRGNGQDAKQSFGTLVANHDDVRAFADGGSKGTMSLNVSHAITSATGSAGELIYTDRETEIVGLPRRPLRIRDLLSVGSTSSNMVEYMRQLSRTLNAAPTAETVQKPESDLQYERAEVPVRTIAHWVAVSRQAMDDAAQLQTEIDTELRYGLDYEEDIQLLSGDGTGENLSGMITNATAYSGARETKISNPTIIDKLRVALLEASLALYPADGIVLHEADWMVIETMKDSDNRYLFANPQGIAGPVLWGRAIVPTLAMQEDKFLVGAFRMAGTIYDRMETEVLISSEDRDNFVKNMLTVRAEKRLAFAVKRPAALIYGDFGLVT